MKIGKSNMRRQIFAERISRIKRFTVADLSEIKEPKNRHERRSLAKLKIKLQDSLSPEKSSEIQDQ